MSYIKEFCEKYGFEAEAVAFLSDAYDRLKDNSQAYEAFTAQVKLYEENYQLVHKPVLAAVGELQELTGIHKYTLTLLYLITLTKHLKVLYEAQNIPEDIFDNSVCDLKWKIRECKRVYNIWGIYVGWWTFGFFKLKLFALGRLQFEVRSFPFSVDNGTLKIDEGEPYINMHIPSCGPLDYAACRESYARAAEFFRQRYNLERIIFVAHSWLLSPDLLSMLPESSRIITFVKDFTILRVDKDPDNKNLDKLFPARTLPENIDDLPGDTALQRAMKDWLKAGNTMDTAFGVFLYS